MSDEVTLPSASSCPTVTFTLPEPRATTWSVVSPSKTSTSMTVSANNPPSKLGSICPICAEPSARATRAAVSCARTVGTTMLRRAMKGERPNFGVVL